jgi:ribosomal-protein-alanine N-acetyltransferase
MMYIRALVKDDIDQIMHLYKGPGDPVWSKKALEDVLTGMIKGAYLAKVGFDEATGQVIAYAVASHVFDQGDVQHITVEQSFRGRGLGRQLLQGLVDGLVAQGVGTVFLEVRPSNGAAVHLYQSMGFVCIQKRQGYYPGVDGVSEDAWVFSLTCL